MQLSPGADTVGLAALAGHLVDIAPDEGESLEGYFQGMLQILQQTTQGLAQTAEVRRFFSLHLIISYRIQIYISQAKNRHPYEKIFSRVTRATTLTGLPAEVRLLSELQERGEVPIACCSLLVARSLLADDFQQPQKGFVHSVN